MNELPQDPADWSALQQLLVQAMSLPAHERNAWVESLPATHHALREPLRRLLEVQAGIETRHFIDATLTAPEVLTPPATVLIGDLVGPYRLLQQIGDGGMGSVWLAERTDGTIKRKIALKLPRMVWARDLASRMARERDILGSLEHPNIARLYDAGVDQLGRPFLALEYVEGQRLDHYCDEHRLTVDGRIRLFLQVLDAVQYAHTNLVLHRDLKPGNILVNQRAEIRLLDFGIAKLIGDDTASSPADALSRSLSRAMTPRYASPEQVQQSRLTLASDVYSLGVMLYELLVGTTPLITHNGSRAELEIAITEGHLRTPSRAKIDPCTADLRQTTTRRLLRILRGELDAVLLKALARNATDRYPSAEALRADLVRWPEGHPVRAKPPSRLLALRKFIARNAWTVGIGTAAVTAVTTAAIIAILQAREARIESRRATATRDFLIGLFENANPELHGGRDIAAKQLLLSGETVLDGAIDFDHRVKADIYSAIATVWSQTGDREKTKTTSAKRVALLERDGPSRALLTALFDYVESCMRTGDLDIAAIYLSRIAELSLKIPLLEYQHAEYDWYIGWIALRKREFHKAEKEFSRSIDSSRQIKDKSRELRALSGRIQSRLGLGDREAAIIDYHLSKSLLDTKGIPMEDQLSRSFEIAAAMYMFGEYRTGWPLMEDVFKKAQARRGKFSAIDSSIHLYWLKWSSRLGKFSEPLLWLEERRAFQSLSEEVLSEINSPKIRLSEVELQIASGNLNAARNNISEISRVATTTPTSKADEFELAVLKLELLLIAREPKKIMRALSEYPWKTSNDSEPPEEWRPYFYWYRGVALGLDSQYRNSETELLIAEAEAAQVFGPLHPRTSLISADRVLMSLMGKSNDGEDLRKKRSYIETLVKRLSDSLGEEHPSVTKAEKIIEQIDRGYFNTSGISFNNELSGIRIY